jgi:riboflavin kinase/FMN adenylyltransferase
MFELEEGQVEAFLMDGFNRDIYGEVLRIQPVRRLRGEAKFDNLEALKEQMARDCKQARDILSE